MFRTISPESNDSDLLYVEQSSNEPSPPRPKMPIVPNSTEMSGIITREKITLSSIAPPGPQFVSIDSNSNEATMTYGFGQQLTNTPPSLNDLNLPPNPFNILTTIAVANPTAEGHDKNYSPQPPEPSELLPISTPPMNLSPDEEWETSQTTTEKITFYSDYETRRIYFLPSSPSPPPPPRKLKRKLSLGMSFPKKGECRSTSARLLDSPSFSRRTYQARRQQTKNSRLKTSYTYITLFPLIVCKRYVVVAYQPRAHICNSCRRYVVVTYRSITFMSC